MSLTYLECPKCGAGNRITDENVTIYCRECGFCIAVNPPELADKKCPFCDITADRIYMQNDVALALSDAFPVTEGHKLIVPKRHVRSIFDLSEEEQAAVWRLVAQVRAKLTGELHLDAFNIGVNDGQAAGQTVPHAHIHIIPRREGDSPDPRGGVRWIKPEKAKYW